MARKTTIRAFEEWAADPANVEGVLELIADGLTLQKAAVEVEKPYTCLHALFETDVWKPKYLAARKAWADWQQDEAMQIADEVKADKDEVAKAKLRVETRQNQARAYHRERWGEPKDGGAGGITVLVDRSCGGTVRVGVKDAGGNQAGIAVVSAEASAIAAEIHEEN